MLQRLLPPLLVLCSLCGLARAAVPVLEAPDAVRPLLQRYLALRDAAEQPSRDAEERRLRKEAAELLATEGYFSPDIAIAWQAEPPRIAVVPGPRAGIAAVALEIDGPVPGELKSSLIKTWALPAGQPFTQAAWDRAKQQTLEALVEGGFAGARLADSQAEVDSEVAAVRLALRYESGPPYRFGPLQIEGLSRYDATLVARYKHSVAEGRPYRASALLALQRSLQNSPYFSSADLSLGAPGPAAADGSVSAPVLLRVAERTPHSVGGGIGVSSNTGARVEANAGTEDLFGKAWRLSTALRLEDLRQGAFADVFLPPTSSGAEIAFGSLRENTDIQDLKTSRYALAARRTTTTGALSHTLSVNWQQEKRRPTDAAASTDRALALNSAWTWQHATAGGHAEQGQSLQLQVGGGSRALLSDQNFVRLYGRYQLGLALGPADSLTLRAEGGMTRAPSRQGIPQDFLFRAGGAGSLRGYAYQSLGVQEGSAVVGGRYLATASAEHTHWWGGWGLASFVDIGDARDDWSHVHPALGYGFGGRWRSPAGPLGVDLAYGQRTHQVHLHFALSLPF